MHGADDGVIMSGNPSDFEIRLRAFLNRAESRQTLRDTTFLGQPAVAGLAVRLLEEFQTELDSDHHRQLVGSITREVMEDMGYEIEKHDVVVTTYPFSKAARYRLRDGVFLQVFRSTGDPREVCISLKRDPSNFPPAPKAGKWKFWTTIRTPLQAALGFDIHDLKQEIATIEQQGYVRRRSERMFR